MLPKGNAIFYHPLKPVENKMGELISKQIDTWIKEGQYERSAKAKKLAEEQARADDLYKSQKIEPEAVQSKYTDFNINVTSKALKEHAHAYEMMRNAKTDYERTKWSSVMTNIKAQYDLLQKTLSSGEFLDAVKKRQEFYQSGDAFDDNAETQQMKSFESLNFDGDFDENGNFNFYTLGDNINDTKKTSLAETIIRHTKSGEVDMLNDTKTLGKGMYSQMDDMAKKATEEYIQNPTGNRLISSKGFNRESGAELFDQYLGVFRQDRPTENDWYSQYARKTLGGMPEKQEEHDLLRENWLNLLEAKVNKESKNVLEKSALETELQRLNIIKAKQDIAENEAKRRRGYVSADSGSGSGGKVEILTEGKSYLQVFNPKTKKNDYFLQDGLMVKGSIGSGTDKTDVFIQSYWDKKTGAPHYGLSIPVKGGGFTTTPLGSEKNGDPSGVQEARKYLSQDEYNKMRSNVGAFFSIPENRKEGKFMDKGVPKRFGTAKIYWH